MSQSLAHALIAEGHVPHRRIGRRGWRGAIRIADDDYRRFMKAVKAGEATAGA